MHLVVAFSMVRSFGEWIVDWSGPLVVVYD